MPAPETFTIVNVGDSREFAIPDDTQIIFTVQLDATTAGDAFAPEGTINGADWLALPMSPTPAGGAGVTTIGPGAGAWSTGNASGLARVRLRKTVDGGAQNTIVTAKMNRVTTSMGQGSSTRM